MPIEYVERVNDHDVGVTQMVACIKGRDEATWRFRGSEDGWKQAFAKPAITSCQLPALSSTYLSCNTNMIQPHHQEQHVSFTPS